MYENVSNLVSFSGCVTEGVVGRKPQIFGGEGWRKNYGSDPKKLGVQNGADVFYAHANFSDQWTHGDRR